MRYPKFYQQKNKKKTQKKSNEKKQSKSKANAKYSRQRTNSNENHKQYKTLKHNRNIENNKPLLLTEHTHTQIRPAEAVNEEAK